MTINRVSTRVGNQEIIIETGLMAKQAHGAVTVRVGDTVILATAVAASKPSDKFDFFPLTVDYRERTYAAGKIPGGYFKREGKPTDRETLTSRLIDRPIRPLFPEDYFNETQIMVTVLSVDGENPSDVPAVIGASAALMISPIPFMEPIGAVRVGLCDGQLVINPTWQQLETSDLDLVIAGTAEKVIMIEAGANEIDESKMLEAIEFGHREIKKTTELQKELTRKVGQPKKAVSPLEISKEIADKVTATVQGEFEKILGIPSKEAREEATRALYEKVLAQFDPAPPGGFKEFPVKLLFDRLEKKQVRHVILSGGKRPDGRAIREIRPITCQVGVLPRTHGSALFTRGQTQSLCVTTLGTGEDEQMIETLEGDVTKRFMLHYNFPSFSVGEVKPNRGPGRREIGHGALAERSLISVMPSKDQFPYTVRLVSDILESNGSSSMATVCGGTLALMDAGVPLKAPVAGIAIGLITEGNKWQVLTDIAGIEDHHGDMDFKAAGTRKGLTAMQMDLKIAGVGSDILKEATQQAKEARFKILDLIAQAIEAPRKDLSAYAPRIVTVQINPSKIGELIGPGGKNIRKIVEETGAKIDIEDDGRVFIASVDSKAAEAAVARVQGCVAEAEVGKIYQGTVRKLVSFGAFCEIMPGTDGLCHVSEVADGFVKSVVDYLRVGDVIPVKVIGVDENGKIKLSIKQAQPGGMPMLAPDVPRDVISELPSRNRDRGGDRSRSRSRR